MRHKLGRVTEASELCNKTCVLNVYGDSLFLGMVWWNLANTFLIPSGYLFLQQLGYKLCHSLSSKESLFFHVTTNVNLSFF